MQEEHASSIRRNSSLRSDPAKTPEEGGYTRTPSSESCRPILPHFLSIDQCLQRVVTRHNILLILEVFLSLLVFFTIDTFSFYGNNVEYTKWSCRTTEDKILDPRCTPTTEINRTNFCKFVRDPSFNFDWTYGSGSSFSTEFGMYCDREDESQTILDISGIGSGLGALIGGLLGDMFGRRPSFGSGYAILVISLITLLFSRTVQIFTLGLFLLGFSQYMALTSLTVTSFELLPHHLRFSFLLSTLAFSCFGVYLGIGIRFLFISSWRAMTGSLLVLLVVGVTPLLFHLPTSPRHRLYHSREGARETLLKLSVTLEEGEEIQIPEACNGSVNISFDYRTHKSLILTVFVIMYLISIVGMTTTPTAGQLWRLVENKNIQFPVQATLQLLAVPVAFLIHNKNLGPRFNVLLLGWLAVGCYFLGELPLGSGVFNINNFMGVILTPINRTLYIFISFILLQVTPTCYRASLFGLSVALQKCFLKIGELMDDIDYVSKHNTIDLHDTSFLVFGVVYLSFVYAASFLPVVVTNVLPNSMGDYNTLYSKRSASEEQAYLLRDLNTET